MKETDKGYYLESTGRTIESYDSPGMSLLEGKIRTGYDQGIWFDRREGDFRCDEPTPEEKIEIAKFVIGEWAEYAGLNVKIL